MQGVMNVLEVIVLVIKLVSVLVLVVGLCLCIKSLLQSAFTKSGKAERRIRIQSAKNDLGWFVLLGLEILIAGDIIETVISPSFADIGRLAAIVAIRTVISFFLNREIRETSEMIERLKHDGG